MKSESGYAAEEYAPAQSTHPERSVASAEDHDLTSAETGNLRTNSDSNVSWWDKSWFKEWERLARLTGNSGWHCLYPSTRIAAVVAQRELRPWVPSAF